MQGDTDIKTADAVKAAELMLNRGWGTAPQVVKHEIAQAEPELALDPANLDAHGLINLSNLLRVARASTVTLEGEVTRREAPTEPTGGGEGTPQEGPPGPDAD